MMVNPALSGALADATERALAEAAIRLPADVLATLRRAAAAESDEIARSELATILKNIALAEERQVPICQDTGVPVVYLTLPPDVPLTPAIYDGIREGVRRATARIPLRPNVVDPITRKNTGNNTGVGMPAIHVTAGDRLTVTVLPKGAGSENTSRIGMLLPSQVAEIPRFVAETMLIAGGRPCPPVFLGVGIGGTFDMAAALAKEALLLPVDTMDEYEQEICDAVNALGIGPMGLGGDTTALAVKVKRADCHTASLPVAVNVQCWACRRATVEVER
ncbi:MAG TPA: fumarate hydratase [Candidatus Methanoculleus thermohydrogenotrophicum]|jgi:fumarate hydratase subunit alpha|nr:fumarate hydratase [Candidatus Methanoculleus thermohydrogenotrophicum]NLM81571.1 fumarate hydratase [Candidatus Methanoculleus thermohydrogenotrophicum]HOB17076.1 fumarate hydratase [Candidatus Methanoculleus thermohydrogenotrophicum]HPZ37156.1 fumarate hydratase [Candidatus Methanoculleus thermohydrogenotrophicum]HQC90629.1 fumarate hydratase [Candidatus Methanoculleus thermohydrogenotrophicum]